jgi:hypothetical protein
MFVFGGKGEIVVATVGKKVQRFVKSFFPVPFSLQLGICV